MPGRDDVPGLVAYALLGCLYVICTGFGIYSFGPWRELALAAAVVVSVAYLALRPGVLVALRPRQVLTVFGIWSLLANWEWAAEPKLLPYLHFSTVVVGAALLVSLRARGLWPVILTAVTAFYVAVVIGVPSPNIDVWDHMNKAAATMLSGQNPYAVPIPDFYKGQAWYGFDAPGFPYPPQVLGLATLARAAGVDVRFVFLGCIVGGAHVLRAAALRAGRSEPTADLVGLAFLFVPRLSFVVKYAHSEPVTGALLAAAVYCLVADKEKLGLVLLGAFFSSKQYLAMIAPLALFYCRTPGRLGWLLLGAVAPWLPFILWGPRALWMAVFQVHMERGARKDALTFSAWLLNHGFAPLPRWIAIAAGFAASALAGLRGRRTLTVSTLLLGMAAAMLPMLALGPQAFQNYYVLVAWIVVAAIAVAPKER